MRYLAILILALSACAVIDSDGPREAAEVADVVEDDAAPVFPECAYCWNDSTGEAGTSEAYQCESVDWDTARDVWVCMDHTQHWDVCRSQTFCDCVDDELAEPNTLWAEAEQACDI